MVEKDKFESSRIPMCLCSSTFVTGALFERTFGRFALIFLPENMNSVAWLCGSGLKRHPPVMSPLSYQFKVMFHIIVS